MGNPLSIIYSKLLDDKGDYVKYKYVYGGYDDMYYRILNETDNTYYVIDRDRDQYRVYKDECEDPFWLEIIPKGSMALVKNQFLSTILEVDIDDYMNMYCLKINDRLTWFNGEDITTINY